MKLLVVVNEITKSKYFFLNGQCGQIHKNFTHKKIPALEIPAILWEVSRGKRGKLPGLLLICEKSRFIAGYLWDFPFSVMGWVTAFESFLGFTKFFCFLDTNY